jgi:hypothetical protein
MRTARLARRLREYDWAAAFIELLIVVVGILIALRVSNWNQERQDHARAENYYQRIHADLLADRQNIDTTLDFWRKVSTYGSEAIAYGESGTLAQGSKWETVLAYYQASQIMPFVASDTTFEEMRSTGDLGLIPDQKLRKELADYYRLEGGSSALAATLRQNPTYRTQIRGLTPWPVQQYIWSHCFQEPGYYDQKLIACPSPVSGSRAEAILATYRKSPGLLDNLRSWMATLRVNTIVIHSFRRKTLQMIAAVEAAQKP